MIVALKVIALSNGKKATFISVFTTTGKVLLADTPLPGSIKYKGVEFFDWHGVFQ